MQRRHRQEELSPQLLADLIKPITRISRHLARERAWDVARIIVEEDAMRVEFG